MPSKTIKIAVAVVFALAATLAAALLLNARQAPPPPELANVLMPEPKPLGAIHLTASDGGALDSQRLAGGWTFLFFGYTHCPDICPTTLLTLQGVRRDLAQTPSLTGDTRFVFVSVDPKRDTPEHLNRYVSFFHPDFLGATGDKAEIDRLVGLAGAVYMFEGDTGSDSYIVNHSATLYLIDPQGRLYGRISPPHTPEEVAALYRSVRRHYGDYPKG